MCGHGEHHRHQGCGCETDSHEQERCACGCGERDTFHHRHHQSGSCGCAPHGGPWERESAFRRRFATREERLAWLEQYLGALRAEAQAVEERIAEIGAK